jgi:prepilin-type N-terminal cleavage/methylation domain-containing protein
MRREAGFTLIEVMIAMILIAIAAMAGVAYVTRGVQQSDWVRDEVFARQKALSILSELRAFVEHSEGEAASDLDGFDDGVGYEPSLTITPHPTIDGQFLPPDEPVSGNISDRGTWRWTRQITVRPFPGIESRDLRICSVKMFRRRPGDPLPGERMAEASSVIRTIGEAFPPTQVYDVYLVACENVPGWWVFMDAIQPFIEATLKDLEGRNPGLKFRAHWVTTLGYGRDEEYAPYTNDERTSRDNIPWAYCYPGTMPDGMASQRYYVPEKMRARVNIDGTAAPIFSNGWSEQESYTDANGNGRWDYGETYVDANGNSQWDVGNEHPYALADMHNHCVRYPEALARFEQRVASGLDRENTPTWRLLLDQMIQDPDRFHNAIIVNLHGELLPMPPARNYSDAAASPIAHPGWRLVAHPEHLAPKRVAGNDVLSVAPRFRVHAYKTDFAGVSGAEVLMTQEEPYLDVNRNGTWDAGEAIQDWNGNATWDAGTPASLVIPGADLSAISLTAPSLVVERLPGGVDADGNGAADSYRPFETAMRYPEDFSDTNGDGIRQVQELFLDLDGNGVRDAGDPHQERDGDGTYAGITEALVDANGNGRFDTARPAEPFTDANGNKTWDAEEPYWDRNGNGLRDGPTVATPPVWQPWDPADFGVKSSEDVYVANMGEPFLDVDGDGSWDAAETFFDANQNGVHDGGFERGEMWYEIRYDAPANRTVLLLHGTPLETPQVGTRGLPANQRLYDLDYIPCPTPDTAAGADRFARDLAWSGTAPKNTARWRITLPTTLLRTAFESAAGAANGDAEDRLLTLEARIGTDLTSGSMWPTRVDPQNLCRTYAWFYSDPGDIPFSERYQMNGDPRHCPYADTDATGTTAAHGYNWFFDNFSNGDGNFQSQWLAFDGGRLRDRWLGRGDPDIGRLYQWLRTGITQSEAIWTTLTGFSYYYLSLGGDVGYDSSNGYANSIPMDGTPFGRSGDLYENTITGGGGDSALRGSRKYVRRNGGASAGIRSGGYWWSKPWLGELFDDATYATQWAVSGNLLADQTNTTSAYKQVRKEDITSAQQPRGTTMRNSVARTAAEGSTSLFNIGSSSSTFHHQFRDGQSGSLVEDGAQLSENYNFPLPTTTRISRPFQLAASGDGGVGNEFGYTSEYPRFTAALVRRYYNHQSSGSVGSALVRLRQPGSDPRGAYIVVNGIDRTTESGSAFIARYSMLSLIHSFFASGVPGSQNRIQQLPRLQVKSPTLSTEIEDPASITVQWGVEWARWDGKPYTDSYTPGFAESETDLTYVPMYSRDGGDTWLSMMDDQPVTPGTVPWIEGVGVDPAKTLGDANDGADESYVWSTPIAKVPQGSYLIRIEAFRSTESLHYTQHMEKIYVNR